MLISLPPRSHKQIKATVVGTERQPRKGIGLRWQTKNHPETSAVASEGLTFGSRIILWPSIGICARSMHKLQRRDKTRTPTNCSCPRLRNGTDKNLEIIVSSLCQCINIGSVLLSRVHRCSTQWADQLVSGWGNAVDGGLTHLLYSRALHVLNWFINIAEARKLLSPQCLSQSTGETGVSFAKEPQHRWSRFRKTTGSEAAFVKRS
jgi:hypothetical protein